MRRAEREITSKDEIMKIMKECKVCNLALFSEDYPYLVPMNFGMEQENEEIVLYFHGAGEGSKIDLIKKDRRASFCMTVETQLELKEPACRSTMRYESVCGSGEISFATEKEEKERALNCIMKQYAGVNSRTFKFEEPMLERITILKFSIKQITGKSNKLPKT